MATLVPFIQYVAQPVVSVTHALAVVLAAMDHRPVSAGLSVIAAFCISTGLIGAACIYWACWVHARLSNFRLAVFQEKAGADRAAQFREALLARGSQPIVVLRNGAKEPQYFADGQDLLLACRSGPDGPALTVALEALVEMGTSFSLMARLTQDRIIAVHGMPIADRAVLFFQEDVRTGPKFRAMLEALPVPVWLYGDDLSLRWANSSFLRTFGACDPTSASGGKALDWLGPDQAAAARDSGKPVEMRHHARIADERRNFAVSLLPAEGEVVGMALDVTAAGRTENRLNLELDANTDMVDRLGVAIAVFDAKRRLTGYNRAYTSLWGFSEAWLDSHPLLDDILERLRDGRKLPEQRSFSEWKLEQIHLFDRPNLSGTNGVVESLWHLPSGASLRMVAQPHLAGGIFMTFEDISERLKLEASVTLLTQVQRATLDTIEDGLAILGTDGRLIQHNSRFAKMWQLTEEELSSQPHFAEIASLCASRIGRDGVWSIVSCAVNSATPETLGEWSKTRRADGMLLSLSLSRLPNGATVVTFTDLTDLERFTAEQNSARQSGGQSADQPGPKTGYSYV